MRRLNVSLAERSYPILIGAGLLSRIDLILPHLGTPRVALITNTTVAPLYMDQSAVKAWRGPGSLSRLSSSPMAKRTRTGNR
jgi:3-dehydroquinate synthetase